MSTSPENIRKVAEAVQSSVIFESFQLEQKFGYNLQKNHPHSGQI